VHIDNAEYQRVLGEELRKLRKNRGWTRKELNQHLTSQISLQTLATYELGTRQCSVVRLVELCLAMDELPQDLLAKVHKRLFTEKPGHIRLDLVQMSGDARPELGPLRRWAKGRLATSSENGGEIYLDPAAIEHMAELCGLSATELKLRLQAAEN
jgi:transcriptional regulator with XRE-family HTH domain